VDHNERALATRNDLGNFAGIGGFPRPNLLANPFDSGRRMVFGQAGEEVRNVNSVESGHIMLTAANSDDHANGRRVYRE
jgi:hypothetical protein